MICYYNCVRDEASVILISRQRVLGHGDHIRGEPLRDRLRRTETRQLQHTPARGGARVARSDTVLRGRNIDPVSMGKYGYERLS